MTRAFAVFHAALVVVTCVSVVGCADASRPGELSALPYASAPTSLDADGPSAHTTRHDVQSASGTVRVEAKFPMSPDPIVIEGPRVVFSSFDLVREIHAGLMMVTDNPNEPFRADLALTFDANSEFTSFLFRLRPALKFSDGSPLTAGDFKWSWERALRFGGDPAATALGSIGGAAEILAGVSSELSGVNIVDDHTIEVNMVVPDPYFLARAATPPGVRCATSKR